MNVKKIESIISAYKILRRNNPDLWIIDCANSKSLRQAIKLAATARNFTNQKHNHQFRIPPAILDRFAVSVLSKINQVKSSKSFDDLISIIDSCRIKGVGDITIYDTAQRIGGYLGLYPQKVYLHGGTRVGAEILIGKIKGKSISVSQLPTPFQSAAISAGEIEDILCIYKNRLSTCV